MCIRDRYQRRVREDFATAMSAEQGEVGEDEAATKLQAAYRGHSQRSRPPSAPQEPDADVTPREEEAATKMQAVYRGHKTRTRPPSVDGGPEPAAGDGFDEDEAAVKLQAAYRGHSTRSRPPSDQGGRSSRLEEDDPKRKASNALDDAERMANDLEEQARLREELRQEQEERLAIEQELDEVRNRYEGLADQIQQLKSRNADVDLKDNERSTVLEAKLKLENELLELKAVRGEAEAKRKKAEQDLTFEQEVRRAAATNRDEAEQRLEEQKREGERYSQELQGLKEQLAGAEQAKRTAEAAAASDRKALEQREEDVMALRIELGEKEAEVRHASKMENLQCSIEIEKLRSELEWKSRMLTKECADLQQRFEEAERRRHQMEQAVGQANAEMRRHKMDGPQMLRMLDDVVARTDGARSIEDSKLRELSSVRDTVQSLKTQAHKQLSALEKMREINLLDADPHRGRPTRFDEKRSHSSVDKVAASMEDLEAQIEQQMGVLHSSVALPPLASSPESPPPKQRRGSTKQRGGSTKRGVGRGRTSRAAAGRRGFANVDKMF
eukprot:TRINITY_DN2226_c0_g1_i2.p1 TRINITY_DN2226_c0_g1~~TRINITY_DN2226_c0_g1_i2.p1  ORF type:complete len:555 (+),score=191.75 TRINITY_DN2226_c0_g1_i2:2-1666(+)